MEGILTRLQPKKYQTKLIPGNFKHSSNVAFGLIPIFWLRSNKRPKVLMVFNLGPITAEGFKWKMKLPSKGWESNKKRQQRPSFMFSSF